VAPAIFIIAAQLADHTRGHVAKRLPTGVFGPSDIRLYSFYRLDRVVSRP
jgi:hypothetical protein